MARSLIRNLVLAMSLASAGLVMSAVDTAQATSLAPLSIDQMTDGAEYIVRGDVQEVWTEVDDKGYIWTRARVAITDTLKGPDSPTELIIDSLGGEYAGQTLTIEGQAVFSEHEELFAFLHRLENGRLVPVSKFQGKYTLRRAPDDRRTYARTWHPGSLEFDARFLPHPAPADRLYFDDLTTQIGQRLQTGWDGKAIPGISPERLAEINTPERRKTQ